MPVYICSLVRVVLLYFSQAQNSLNNLKMNSVRIFSTMIILYGVWVSIFAVPSNAATTMRKYDTSHSDQLDPDETPRKAIQSTSSSSNSEETRDASPTFTSSSESTSDVDETIIDKSMSDAKETVNERPVTPMPMMPTQPPTMVTESSTVPTTPNYSTAANKSSFTRSSDETQYPRIFASKEPAYDVYEYPSNTGIDNQVIHQSNSPNRMMIIRQPLVIPVPVLANSLGDYGTFNADKWESVQPQAQQPQLQPYLPNSLGNYGTVSSDKWESIKPQVQQQQLQPFYKAVMQPPADMYEVVYNNANRATGSWLGKPTDTYEVVYNNVRPGSWSNTPAQQSQPEGQPPYMGPSSDIYYR